MTRHDTFYDLHQSGCFVMPNPWDIGSAKVMAAKGAKALGTTSSGHAFTLGRPDMGGVSRDEALAHAQDIVAATPLPVSGDFEDGYGDAPETVAETVRLAAEAGLSGCSVEDTNMANHSFYDFDLTLERIKAGSAAAKSLGRPFVFCARADGVMNGVYDLDEGMRRLQAFEAAGADLLYLPLPPDMTALAKIVESVSAPVNGLAAGGFLKHSVADFAAAGVRRISLGSAMARMAHQTLLDSCDAILGESQNFAEAPKAANGDMVDAMLR